MRKDWLILFDKLEYIKQTLEIEGHTLTEKELKFLKEIEEKNFTKEQILGLITGFLLEKKK